MHMPPTSLDTPDRNNLRTISSIVFVLFIVIAIALFFWSVVRAASILERSDNPRLVEEEQRIRRGTIFDRNNNILAINKGEIDDQQRVYTFDNFGPAVGFYSLIHGTAGAEEGFNVILRNDPASEWQKFWQTVLHTPQIGDNVKLALDANLEEVAVNSLNNQPGAILVLEIDQDNSDKALVKVLASSPTYNPNNLDQEFEILAENPSAPLLNRVTQGQYQPGLLFQPFIIAYALDQGLIELQDSVVDPDRLEEVNGDHIGCQTPPPDPANWYDVLQHQCPGPMIDLADRLGSGGLDSMFNSFGFNRDPTLETDTTTIPDEPLGNPFLAGIGQDNQSITPLQIGLAMSAIVNDGILPSGQIGYAVQAQDGSWQRWSLENDAQQAIGKEAANTIKRGLAINQGIFEHAPLVLSGPESINAWYIGILELGGSDYVAVVILEGVDEKGQAVQIGREILNALKENTP